MSSRLWIVFLSAALFHVPFVKGQSEAQAEMVVSSLEELIEVTSKSDLVVTMPPGRYRMIDAIPLESIPERRQREEFQLLTFSGSNNHFRLDGVVIEIDTRLRQELRQPIHTDEILITGDNNTIEGLTIVTVGEGTSPSGALLGIAGEGTTLRDCSFEVTGSSPYGYGDLFGKGGRKHSGVHIVGSRTTLLDCSIQMRSFGHGFYIQEDANDIRFERCHVEGRMRSSDEILAEESGLAFDKQFKMVMRNRAGDYQILPGYQKALSEDAFRTYGRHENLVFIDCTAKWMRGGFELRTPTAPVLRGCRVIECERGFWVSSGARLIDCQGDAMYGPLFYLEGDDAEVDLTVQPGYDPDVNVHAVGAVYGSGNRLTLRGGDPDGEKPPILLGWGPPGAGENMAPFSEKQAKGVIINNSTGYPIRVAPRVEDSRIRTNGKVLENAGKNIIVEQ